MNINTPHFNTIIDELLTEGKKSYSAKKAHAGKDIGKKGRQFSKISKSAAKKYGSKAA